MQRVHWTARREVRAEGPRATRRRSTPARALAAFRSGATADARLLRELDGDVPPPPTGPRPRVASVDAQGAPSRHSPHLTSLRPPKQHGNSAPPRRAAPGLRRRPVGPRIPGRRWQPSPAAGHGRCLRMWAEDFPGARQGAPVHRRASSRVARRPSRRRRSEPFRLPRTQGQRRIWPAALVERVKRAIRRVGDDGVRRTLAAIALRIAGAGYPRALNERGADAVVRAAPGRRRAELRGEPGRGTEGHRRPGARSDPAPPGHRAPWPRSVGGRIANRSMRALSAVVARGPPTARSSLWTSDDALVVVGARRLPRPPSASGTTAHGRRRAPRRSAIERHPSWAALPKRQELPQPEHPNRNRLPRRRHPRRFRRAAHLPPAPAAATGVWKFQALARGRRPRNRLFPRSPTPTRRAVAQLGSVRWSTAWEPQRDRWRWTARPRRRSACGGRSRPPSPTCCVRGYRFSLDRVRVPGSPADPPAAAISLRVRDTYQRVEGTRTLGVTPDGARVVAGSRARGSTGRPHAGAAPW